MKSMVTMKVMELEIQGLTDIFDEQELRQRAHTMVSDLTGLLGLDTLLHHTTLTHRYRLRCGETDLPSIFLVLELTQRTQRLLQFESDGSTLGTLEKNMLEDREHLRRACQELPVQNSHATIALARRLQAAFLNSPDEALPQKMERQLNALVHSRHRRWNGQFSEDHPWQMELPALPRYEWIGSPVHVYVKLLREKRGYTLILLRRAQLPAVLHSTKRLRMHERPSRLEDATLLDRAEYTGTPIELVVRIGSIIGSDDISVADFARLA